MKTTLITIILFTLFAGYTSAQGEYHISTALDFYRINKTAKGEIKHILTEKDISGSPFLNDEFITGSIFTTSKVKFVEIPLRYNIYNENLEFKSPENKVLAMSAPEIVEKAVFGEYTMTYIPFANAKKIRRGFFKVLLEGKASLYARPIILYEQAKEPGAYKDAQPAKFIKRPDTYYIRIGKDAAQKTGNKKEVINMFPDYQNEIATFIKKNKIKTSKPEGLKKLVEYYNSL